MEPVTTELGNMGQGTSFRKVSSTLGLVSVSGFWSCGQVDRPKCLELRRCLNF